MQEIMPFNECLIDGQKVHYDACSVQDLEKAQEFYGPAYKYIGSGYVTFHNGTKNTWDYIHHFFKRQND